MLLELFATLRDPLSVLSSSFAAVSRGGGGVCDVHHNTDGKCDDAAGVAPQPNPTIAVLAGAHLCGGHSSHFSSVQVTHALRPPSVLYVRLFSEPGCIDNVFM